LKVVAIVVTSSSAIHSITTITSIASHRIASMATTAHASPPVAEITEGTNASIDVLHAIQVLIQVLLHQCMRMAMSTPEPKESMA
jgi:hypothetical protein